MAEPISEFGQVPVLTLRGGADPSERDETLALRRAEAVRAQLIKLGVTPERLRVDPQPAPPTPCCKASCRERNQRVWIGVADAQGASR
jgi:outer membrane protein OmpA-like peptidoglycan-associated protein